MTLFNNSSLSVSLTTRALTTHTATGVAVQCTVLIFIYLILNSLVLLIFHSLLYIFATFALYLFCTFGNCLHFALFTLCHCLHFVKCTFLYVYVYFQCTFNVRAKKISCAAVQ